MQKVAETSADKEIAAEGDEGGAADATGDAERQQELAAATTEVAEGPKVPAAAAARVLLIMRAQ